MEGVQGTVPAPDRVLGTVAPGAGVTVAYHLGATQGLWAAGVTPQDRSANLNGTYASLDCYSNPDQCLGEYWQGVGAKQPRPCTFHTPRTAPRTARHPAAGHTPSLMHGHSTLQVARPHLVGKRVAGKLSFPPPPSRALPRPVAQPCPRACCLEPGGRCSTMYAARPLFDFV